LKTQEPGLPEIKKPKILIFISKTGGGHVSLAEALRDLLDNRFEINMADPQPSAIHFHYRLVSRHALWLWAAEFRLSDTPARARAAHRLYTTLFLRNVARVLKLTQPDLVITTYPFLTSEVTAAMRHYGRRVPFAMQLADPNSVHHSWLTEHKADLVLAPTFETYQQALNAGFHCDQLFLTGWPVRAQFYRNSLASRTEKLAQLGLDPKRFTVFLQGGGEGAAKFVNTIENILRAKDIQIILATGSNKALLERFQNTPSLYALPFTPEIAKFMDAADVVMGKAGPNMLFEAGALGKPFIATTYIPGQEQGNLHFIENHRLGWTALDLQAQIELLNSLTQNPARYLEKKSCVEEYRRWNFQATESIAPLVTRLLEQEQKLG
jgi:UDP-N-acetylglucosamine:LPS N-acetylglucosamine transferase